MMQSDCFEGWMSLYSDDLRNIWASEKKELRKISMIYNAFEKELKSLKLNLFHEITTIKADLKRKELLENLKHSPLSSEKAEATSRNNKEDEAEFTNSPLKEVNLNDATNEFFSDSFENSAFSGSHNSEILQTSPRINRSRSTRQQENTPSPSFIFYRPDRKQKVERLDFDATTNVADCSVIEGTPDHKKTSKGKPISKWLSKSKTSKSDNKLKNTTLTQFLKKPQRKKPNKNILNEISDARSMDIDDMLEVIQDNNYSSGDETVIPNSETIIIDEEEDDKTLDNLFPPSTSQKALVGNNLKDFVEDYDKVPEKSKKSPDFGKRVVRGNERKKLKGWACKQCEKYYENMNLPPQELEKKKDICSRHRSNHSPDDTDPGIWDFTFGASPKTQPAKKK